jgi:type IV pilus assembly protein PilY1
MFKTYFKIWIIFIVTSLVLISPFTVLAIDTDIYQFNVKQNCYILLDSSDSMGFGVYESNVNYSAMFDYLFTLNDTCEDCYEDYIYDGVVTWDPTAFFGNPPGEKNRIYLLPGEIGIGSRIDENGDTQLFSGDAADPNYLWHANSLIDTYTDINSEGNLVAAFPEDATKQRRLTVDGDGYILFDGTRLPFSQDALYRHEQILYGGGKIEDGFGDLLNAPGYYFSGFTSDASGQPTVASGGESTAFFFITGNWISMQTVYNLVYTTNNPDPQGASTGDQAWQFEHFPIADNAWPTINYDLDYPSGALEYEPNIKNEYTIKHPGTEQIRVHFDLASFDVNATVGTGLDKGDWLIIENADGDEVARYNNDNLPLFDGWSPNIDGDTAIIILESDSQENGTGYIIDYYAYNDDVAGYLMKNRLGVATGSILNTIEEFRGKINWGTFTFPVANGGDGATSQQVINPSLTDDSTRENIASDFGNISPADEAHGTPIGEALQEVFEVGYYQHRNAIDNLTCRKNYAIVLSDGFPSHDDNWSLIDGVTFDDFDGDGFKADPYKYLGQDPPEDYYDDVAHWMYTHSWHDKSEVPDPANSYENVYSHHISFGFQNPLMQDAAEEAGGMYITAYNEGQLNAAFYALGLAMSQATSFTAPVVSVDEANKVQNGDDLYMGQFIPLDTGYWPGNLKKFQLGDGSTDRPDFWAIYDSANNPATDASGLFLDDTDGFWGDELDNSDVNTNEVADIQEDGVGEVLTERVVANFSSGNYTERNIKTYIGDSLVDFDRTNVSPTDLGLGTDTGATDILMRDKVVNWIHGYTFDADIATGNPVDKREWALGAIIHSRPTVVDYYDDEDYSVLEARYIAVGADDGMLHVFYDDTDPSDGIDPLNGKEVFAFVPTDALNQLPALENEENHIALVDGYVKLFRENGHPKYLFFGLRRGGRSYWKIDVSDPNPTTWTVSQFADGELGQSWSDMEFAKIRTGDTEFTNVAIFSGGYDAMEDNYPEPFNDLNNNGTPYADNGSIDGQEWDKNDANQDVLANNLYDVYNPNGNTHGRAIYVVDVDTLSVVFSVKAGDSNEPATPGTFDSVIDQIRVDMQYCFPATPSVVGLSEYYSDTSGVYHREDNVLAAIYAPDIYGNLFRVTYDYDGGSPKWQTKRIFSANPGSDNLSGDEEIWQTDNNDDQGRKVFYGPAVSWRGSGRYFDPSNYYYPDTTFYNTNTIASLFFGTGDREHPSYQLVSNRVYAIYDDSPVFAQETSLIDVSSAPYGESDLLNITCDELGINTALAGATATDNATYKLGLETLLLDDVKNPDALSMELDSGGAGEDDAKGWYIVLEQQGLSPFCDHCDYPATIYSSEGGRDYHYGEKILSKMTLFAGNLYFTSYQPSYDDPCQPEGNAFTYALNYLNGAAALNLNQYNDVEGDEPVDLKDVTDRYNKLTGVKGIPSSFEVVIRGGKAAAMSSIGGAIVGGGEDGFEIPYEESGLDLYYWIER